MIEVTVLYHEETDDKDKAKDLYNTIHLLITSQFEELEVDKDIVIELKEFND